MPLIKRYPNRKLYDTASKHYISLDDIAAMIRAGDEVTVVDHVTGDDLTALILMQVIVEQEKRQGGFLPQSVVAGWVQAGGDTLDALRRAMIKPFDFLRQVDDEIERRIQSLVGLGELAEEEGQRLRGLLLGWGRRVTETALPEALADLGVPSRKELRALAEQLDALEAELARLEQERKTG